LGSYAEPLFEGTYINIELDKSGIPKRKVIHPENLKQLPEKEIFLFGGSTTMGMHVADKDTYASFLAFALNEGADNIHFYRISNFGRIGHTPTQEVLLFYDLLRLGRVPHLAVFMDGLNKGSNQDLSLFSKTFVDILQKNRYPSVNSDLLYRKTMVYLPMLRLARSFNKKLNPEMAELNTQGEDLIGAGQLNDTINYTLNRFLENYAFLSFLEERFKTQAIVFSQPDVSTH
jgi:hypothetical protein